MSTKIDLSGAHLARVRQAAQAAMRDRSRAYLDLLPPEFVVAVISELESLRADADPQALTICYLEGAHKGRERMRKELERQNLVIDHLALNLAMYARLGHAGNTMTEKEWRESAEKQVAEKLERRKR